MFALAPEILALLIAAAVFAGFVDAIAGGGGLITVPALLLAGLAPVEALGTNKVQGVFGAGTAAISYAARGHVDLRAQAPRAVLAFLAAMVGAALVAFVPAGYLKVILPVVLVGIAVFFAVKPGLDDLDRAERMAPAAFGITAVPLIAGYDGLIGPGAGAFYMIAFVTLAGYGVLKATAHTKFLNFASNLGGLAAFALVGAPLWGLGLAMGLAQIAGARLGAVVAMRAGARLIRPMLVVVSGLMAAKLVWDAL